MHQDVSLTAPVDDNTGDGPDPTGNGSEENGDSEGSLPFLTLPLMVAAVLGVALVLVVINRKD